MAHLKVTIPVTFFIDTEDKAIEGITRERIVREAVNNYLHHASDTRHIVTYSVASKAGPTDYYAIVHMIPSVDYSTGRIKPKVAERTYAPTRWPFV